MSLIKKTRFFLSILLCTALFFGCVDSKNEAGIKNAKNPGGKTEQDDDQGEDEQGENKDNPDEITPENLCFFCSNPELVLQMELDLTDYFYNTCILNEIQITLLKEGVILYGIWVPLMIFRFSILLY